MGRPAETYRAARRNGCRQGYSSAIQGGWSPEWYFQGSKKAYRHEAEYRREMQLFRPVSQYHPLQWVYAAWMQIKADRRATRAAKAKLMQLFT